VALLEIGIGKRPDFEIFWKNETQIVIVFLIFRARITDRTYYLLRGEKKMLKRNFFGNFLFAHTILVIALAFTLFLR
jgi:hypothetical protein